MIQKVKGTQDFLDLKLYNFVTQSIKKHLEQYNFHEIATPILEKIELFSRSVGESSDIITKEMFTLKTKGDDVLCLRPEATAAIVRAFLENNVPTLPWKVFTVGPMFRYERPQKGRFRQFHQVSIEVIGSKSILEDTQLIKMLDQIFRHKLNLDNYVLAINFIGNKEDRQNFNNLIKDFLESKSNEICLTCAERKDKNPLRIFDCKNEQCKEIFKNAPKITDNLSEDSQKEWQKLKENLEFLSVPYVHNPELVRGLDYYNKTVFEFVSTGLGAQNAFCGGGRYDQLTTMLGGKEDQPSIGAAIGLERLIDLVEQNLENLKLPEEKALNVVIPLSEDQNSLALLLSNDLINKNIVVQTLFNSGNSVKSLMKKANKLGAKFVILLGEDEQKTQTATVKNMITGTEEKVKQIDVNKIIG